MATREEILRAKPEWVRIIPFCDFWKWSVDQNFKRWWKVTEIDSGELDVGLTLRIISENNHTWIADKWVILGNSDLEPAACQHEFIPMFNSISCKKCGLDRDNERKKNEM
jgi:hypothetical protein